jgi:hypothetical protein
MDVDGRNPTSEAGEYFRASIHAWPSILELMRQLGADLLGEELLKGMARNDGHGPENQEVCTALADRFDQWLAQHQEGFCHEEPADAPSVATWLRKEGFAVSAPPRGANNGMLREWAKFLRHCGGFQVW